MRNKTPKVFCSVLERDCTAHYFWHESDAIRYVWDEYQRENYPDIDNKNVNQELKDKVMSDFIKFVSSHEIENYGYYDELEIE